jgi:hypothetical protein
MFGGFGGAGDDMFARAYHDDATGETFLQQTQGISS